MDKNHNLVYGANGSIALIPAGFYINSVLTQGQADSALRSNPNTTMIGSKATTEDLAKFARGGPWDLQRLSGQFAKRFIDMATILIGMFAQAAGITRDQILTIENTIAITSKYPPNTQFDQVYTYLPVRNVRNTDIGMNLVSSGAYVW